MRITTGLLLGLGSWWPSAADASAVLDQSYAPASFPDGYSFLSREGSVPDWEIQTFTAGLTGQLAELDLPIWQDPAYDTGLTVDIFTFNGTQLGSLLGTLAIPSSSVPDGQGGGVAFPPSGTNPFAMILNTSSLGMNVTSGQSYAIAASATVLYPAGSAGNGIVWLGSAPTGTDNYPGGGEFFTFTNSIGSGSTLSGFGPDADLGFRTFVSPVAEPASVTVLAIGVLGLRLAHRRKAWIVRESSPIDPASRCSK
jgi:hypothetical protein